jgi:RND superfamily putative drug exporter
LNEYRAQGAIGNCIKGYNVSAIINFITGRKTAWATLLIGLIFAVLAFGPLAAKTAETVPGVGLPADTESVIVDEKLATLDRKSVV